MSRLSQFFWAVNAKKFPDKHEQLVRYTSLEFTDEVKKLIKAKRRERLKYQDDELDGDDV